MVWLFGDTDGLGGLGLGQQAEPVKLELPDIKIEKFNAPSSPPLLYSSSAGSLLLGSEAERSTAVDAVAKQLTDRFSAGPETTASNIMGWPSAIAPQPAPTLSFNPSKDIKFQNGFSNDPLDSTGTTLKIGDANNAIYLTSMGNTVGVHVSASEGHAKAEILRLARIQYEQQRAMDRERQLAQLKVATDVTEALNAQYQPNAARGAQSTPSASYSTARSTTDSGSGASGSSTDDGNGYRYFTRSSSCAHALDDCGAIKYTSNSSGPMAWDTKLSSVSDTAHGAFANHAYAQFGFADMWWSIDPQVNHVVSGTPASLEIADAETTTSIVEYVQASTGGLFFLDTGETLSDLRGDSTYQVLRDPGLLAQIELGLLANLSPIIDV